MVEAPRIESPATSVPRVVDRREDDAEHATKGDSKRRVVSAAARTSTDDAIREAAKLAIDEGGFPLAHALLDVLASRP